VVTYPDDSRTTFSYNGEGKRLQVQEGAGTIEYLYDLDKVVLERDGAGNLLARYTHEGGSLYHDLVSMRRGGASYYFLFDGLGSVTEVVDSSENTQNSYRYEAWGQVQSSTENITNPYRYIGAYGVHWDSSPALYFMQARYYMASVGRFIALDPLRGAPRDPISLHRYLYVGNNSVNYTDAFGLQIGPPPAYIVCMNKCYFLCNDLCEAINRTVRVTRIDCRVSCRDACDSICKSIFPGYCGPTWKPGAWEVGIPAKWCHAISSVLCVLAAHGLVSHLMCEAADTTYCHWLQEHPPIFW